ncbi:MAG: SCO family protein [Rhodospirillaceae bacterium]|nr:SCO family protein [Rhodospirillaceae bacterium]
MNLRAKKISGLWVIIILIVMSLIAATPVQAHDDSAKSSHQEPGQSARTVTKESFPGAAKFEPQAAYNYSQSAIGKTVGHYKFISTENKIVNLNQYLGKPLVLSMVYSSCAHTCPVMTQNLMDAVKDAREALGSADFNVISVGFDTLRDTPRAMKSFAKQQAVGDANWQVLSGKPDVVERLSADTGFIYFTSPKGFDHLTQTTLIDAKGEVYAQIYGQDFEATRLTEPLKQLLLGTAKSLTSFDSLLNQVKLFCTIYDPYAGKYRFDYSFFIGMFLSAVVLLLIGSFLVKNIWRLWFKPADQHSETSNGSTI